MPEDGLTVERAIARLVADGFLRADGAGPRSTPRLQAALARAAWELQRADAPWRDLRLPIARALAEHYRDLSDRELAVMVEAVLPVEERALAPAFGTAVIARR